MYLSHIELDKVVGSIISDCAHTEHPFDAKSQVKVCSIDLRLSNIFWSTKKRGRAVDLGGNTIYELSPRRLWKKHVLNDGDAIEIKPGEMLLGRTYEKISIPKEFVGKINTRSSYARLGLSTACNCDLVNPGYVGFVPVELQNMTRNTIKIRPYLSICQLFVMRVDGVVEDSYASDRFKSLYMNDEGTPSEWWRDDLAKKVSKTVFDERLTEAALAELRLKFNEIDDSGLERLDQLIVRKKFNNASELMDAFSKSEKNLSLVYRALKYVASLGGAGLVAQSALQVQRVMDGAQYDWVMIMFWVSTAIVIPVGAYLALTKEWKFYSDIDVKASK